MNSYLLIKSIHVTTAVISVSGFLLRAYWRFYYPDKLKNRLVKILPHLNDTLLLVSAIMLTRMLQQYPLTHHWLTAKVLLLILYIIAGSVALKTHYSEKISKTALLIALVSFSSIILTAIFH